jgi:hypothetical protein
MTTPISEDTLLASPPRRVPPGTKMLSTYGKIYLTAGTVLSITEAIAIYMNEKHGGHDDFIKRTISENIWWLFAWHPDNFHTAKYAKLRRLAFVIIVAWFPGHIMTNGDRF